MFLMLKGQRFHAHQEHNFHFQNKIYTDLTVSLGGFIIICMLHEKLLEIGLSDNESKVYLDLLRVGPQKGGSISKISDLNRSTVYTVLKSLEEKGLISSCVSQGSRLFVASDPNCLVGYVDRKCRTFDYRKMQLVAAIPQFRGLNAEYSFRKPVVRYFDGIEGTLQVMNDALSANMEICSYFAINDCFDACIKDFWSEFCSSSRLDFRVIAPDNPEVRAFLAQFKTANFLFVSDPDCFKSFGTAMNIYGNTVSTVYLEKGLEYGVVIESKEIADMNRMIFEVFWKAHCSINNC